MTSNCIIPVKDSYKDRIFTAGVTGYPGVPHIEARRPDGTRDFSEIIALAKTCPPPIPIDSGSTMGGFKLGQLRAATPKILELVRQGRVKRFIVIGGCDGRNLDREYYKLIATKLPSDTIILTAGCTKYPFFKLDLGNIDGIPRVLDAGQCSD
jgi:hydroxylamine reductase